MIIENKISLNGLIAWVAVQKGVRPTIAVTCAKLENVYYSSCTFHIIMGGMFLSYKYAASSPCRS